MAANVVGVIAAYGPYILEGYTFLKKLGVFSRDSSEVESAISSINAQISEMRGQISELSIRIDQLDRELRSAIKLVEYDRIANAVLSTNSVFRRYLEIGDREGIARLLPLSDREESDLRVKLDRSNGFFDDYLPAFLNLYLIHAQSKIIIDIAAAGNEAEAFMAETVQLKDRIALYYDRCLEVVRRVEREKYTISFTQFYVPVQVDSRDPVVGQTFRGIGYSYNGNSAVEVSRYEFRSGSSDVLSQGNAEREAEARTVVESKILELVNRAARDACSSYGELVAEISGQ